MNDHIPLESFEHTHTRTRLVNGPTFGFSFPPPSLSLSACRMGTAQQGKDFDKVGWGDGDERRRLVGLDSNRADKGTGGLGDQSASLIGKPKVLATQVCLGLCFLLLFLVTASAFAL